MMSDKGILTKKRADKQPRCPSLLILCGSMGSGGKERQIIELLKGVKKNNQFTTFLAVGKSNGEREVEATALVEQVWRLRRLPSNDPLTPLIQLISKGRRKKIDLIHTWGSGIWDLTGWIVARYFRIPFIHGGIRSAPLVLDLPNKITRWVAQHADVIVANSYAGLDAFGYKDHARARVIYNGVDLNRFNTNAALPDARQTICMVANFSEKKDHTTLINSLPYIRGFYPDIRLLLVGKDAGTLDKTRKLVKSLGLDNSVEFITDSLDPESFIASSQICILSTFTEGISNSILEYMGLRKAVIATMNSGNAEVVENGVTGFLIPPNSPQDLSRYTVHLLQNPNIAREVGEAGYLRLKEKFSLEQMVKAYESLYFSLL